jgi:lipoprotein signal peptidase
LIYLPLLFPDGRLLSHRWLPVAVVPGIATLGAVVLGALVDTLVLDPVVETTHYTMDNPIGIEGLAQVEDLPIFGVMNVLLVVGVVGAAASVVVRFRRSQGVERQQMKWF